MDGDLWICLYVYAPTSAVVDTALHCTTIFQKHYVCALQFHFDYQFRSFCVMSLCLITKLTLIFRRSRLSENEADEGMP